MKLLEYIIELIYPRRCVVCGDVLGFRINKVMCNLCEEVVADEQVKLIKYKDLADFSNSEYANSIIAIFEYAHYKEALSMFKFKSCKNHGFVLGEIMYEKVINFNQEYFNENHLITYVPMHKKKEKMRGFNQAKILAQEISKCGNINFEENILIKKAKTKTQSTLEYEQRQSNIKNAFEVINSSAIKNKIVLLIDDVCTTGATLDECCRVLINAGAKEVNVLTLCVTTKK